MPEIRVSRDPKRLGALRANAKDHLRLQNIYISLYLRKGAEERSG